MHREFKKGDLVRISSNENTPMHSYGVVILEEPIEEQVSLFPSVVVFSFLFGRERTYYPYNLEVVSSAA